MFFGKIPSVPRDEAIFRRDHYKCQYCGLDRLESFENWMIMAIDHIHAYAKGGAIKAENQATACQPCNTIKGTRDFSSRAEAKKYVQAKRAEWHEVYKEQRQAVSGAKSHAAHAGKRGMKLGLLRTPTEAPGLPREVEAPPAGALIPRSKCGNRNGFSRAGAGAAITNPPFRQPNPEIQLAPALSQ